MAARKRGFQMDIGSLEAGKLADLVVPGADPLSDIRHSDKIATVMINGRLYEAATLNEFGTGNWRSSSCYWEYPHLAPTQRS